ncbi:MAG: glycosyltransferase family 4 protein [Rhodospirillaceae bacterium]|nr:glycosyltransferase family 4 protein [Rhodospirillaceae bacterium]
MKSPNSEVPSGDRRVARSLIEALKICGHEVEIASELKAREPTGDLAAQKKLQSEGHKIAEELIAQYTDSAQCPDIWFTYRLYYKAMDWIGPLVSKALNIPYVAAEVSYAPKRAGGPWDMSHRVLGDIIQHADAIISLNSLDSVCVLPVMKDPSKLISLKPFMKMPSLIDGAKARAELVERHQLEPNLPMMVTVAMMRDDAKLQSYEVLGQALKNIKTSDWQLLVIGDGPARAQVESHLGTDRVVFLGELPENEISPILAGCDLFVWPAVNEAYGMAMLEAQAMGLPVIAGATGGVADIIRAGETGLLCEVGNAVDFAAKVSDLLTGQVERKEMSEAAIKIVRNEHSIEAAAKTLDQTLRALIQ